MWLQQNFHKMNPFPIKHIISEEVASPDGKRLDHKKLYFSLLLMDTPKGHHLEQPSGPLFALGNHLHTPVSHGFRSRLVASSQPASVHYSGFS